MTVLAIVAGWALVVFLTIAVMRSAKDADHALEDVQARRRARGGQCPETRPVGCCGACGEPLLFKPGGGLECPCGTSSVPASFFRVARMRR